MNDKLNIVVLGLSITSSWGNGHATTYRSLLSEFAKLGHKILFLERDVPWYAQNRDMPNPAFCEFGLYKDFQELKQYQNQIRTADFVIVGSYVKDGAMIGKWASDIANKTAFYDIDTPVTLNMLKNGWFEYISPEMIARYDLYLSFTGGPILQLLKNKYLSPAARPLYCSVDTSLYFPQIQPIQYDLGYIGTYSDDRQPTLNNFLLDTAVKYPLGKFVVAGSSYPDEIKWPVNVERIKHLPPCDHRNFYNSQRFTLNVTRSDMIAAGFSPSVRLFEAGACGTCIISDSWAGLDTIFKIGEEILVSHSTEDMLGYLHGLAEDVRKKIGMRARDRILREHTAAHRAMELEKHLFDIIEKANSCCI